jgi:ribonuclease D
MAPFIDNPDALATALPLLEPHDRIAIDTEADSLHCYFEKLCLIQISVPGSDFLVDPLAGMSLEPLFDSFRNKELILHGADYDLRLMRRVGFAAPDRIFDTMIAARLIGLAEFSLAALIERYFQVKLTKASQKANWALRPLPQQMAEYAVNDTRYLHRLTEIFEGDLRRLGRWEWFQQSCERAIRTAQITKDRDPEQLWRITGSHELEGRATAILRALWHWRDEEAQALDRPSFHILHNEQLIESAARFDQGRPVELPHLKGGRRRRFFEAAERALGLSPEDWPKFVRKPRPRPTREEEARFRDFKTRRDTAASELKLDPSLIAPKTMLENLAANPAETSAQMMPWQRAALGLEP